MRVAPKQQPSQNLEDDAEYIRKRLEQKAKKPSKAVKAVRKNEAAEKCGANLRGGGTCKRVAGQGTDHLGVGNCFAHGGASPNHRKKTATQQLRRLAGRELVDIDPMQAILMCVRITAMEVKVFSEKIEELGDIENIIERPDEQVVAGMHADRMWIQKQKQLSIWVRERERAMKRLVQFSKEAISLGIDERQVRVAERMGDLMAETIGLIMNDLELTPEQRTNLKPVLQKRLGAFQIEQVAS